MYNTEMKFLTYVNTNHQMLETTFKNHMLSNSKMADR